MNPSNSADRYELAYVFQITLKDDKVGVANAEHLGEVWKEYGFEVRKVDESTLGVSGNVDEELSSKFREFLTEVDPEGDDPDSEGRKGKRKLIIVEVYGHGGINNGSLIASR